MFNIEVFNKLHHFLLFIQKVSVVLSVKKSLKKFPSFKKVIVACSGGVDSVVLAHVLKELGYDLVLAHLNHQLRGGESDRDEAFVGELAQKWNLKIEIQRTQIFKKGNLENNGRKARYKFFESIRQKHEAPFIALAHHQNDQLETILMHVFRGAGLRGLRGMQFISDYLIRPILDVSKKQILEYAKKNQLDYRTDQTNNDLSFTRNRWRHLGIPFLENHFPQFKKELLGISFAASEKLKKLSAEAQKWLSDHLKENYFEARNFIGLPKNLQSEILIQMLGSQDLYDNEIQNFLHLIRKNHSGAQRESKNQRLTISHGRIYFHSSNVSSDNLPEMRISESRECQWGSWSLKNISDQILFVRSWKKGDRFYPSGMHGSKKLQDFFVDQKIPKHERKKIPVIVDEKNVIMAVADYRVAKGAEQLKTKLLIQKTS